MDVTLLCLAPLVALALVSLFAFAGCSLDRSGVAATTGTLRVVVRFYDPGVPDAAGFGLRVRIDGVVTGIGRAVAATREFYEAAVDAELEDGDHGVEAEIFDPARMVLLSTAAPCSVSITPATVTVLDIGQPIGRRELVCMPLDTATGNVHIVLFTYDAGGGSTRPHPPCSFQVRRLDPSPISSEPELFSVETADDVESAPLVPGTRFRWGPVDVFGIAGRYRVDVLFFSSAGVPSDGSRDIDVSADDVTVRFWQLETGPVQSEVFD
jgi:hypothetical protein